MLTASQCRTVAFLTDGGIICPDCARTRTNDVHVARCESGLEDDLRPLSAYEAGEWAGQDAYEQYEVMDVTEEDPEAEEADEGDWIVAYRDGGRAAGPFGDEWRAEQWISDQAALHCDDCGQEIED